MRKEAATEREVKRAIKDSKRDNYDDLLAKAQNPTFDPAFIGKNKEQVQQMLKERSGLTGADFAKIDAGKLTASQNLKALGHELRSQSYTPNAIMKRGWENMGEGGGGWAGGTRMGRHNLLGANANTAIFALGDLKDAYNKTDPTGEGRSRTERLGSAAGGALGGVVGSIGASKLSRIPGGGFGRLVATLGAGIGGMMGGYYLGSKAGKMTDKAVSKARGVTAGDYKQDLLRRAGAPQNKDGSY